MSCCAAMARHRAAVAFTCWLLAGAAPVSPAAETCVDVRVGSAQSYDCLNAQLAAVARNAPRFSSATNTPYSATSAPNVTGQFDEDATRQRLGSAFGHSVAPQRPTATYAAPFAPAATPR